MSLLLKQKQELEMEGDAVTGSSFELNIIWRILQEAELDTQIKKEIHKNRFQMTAEVGCDNFPNIQINRIPKPHF